MKVSLATAGRSVRPKDMKPGDMGTIEAGWAGWLQYKGHYVIRGGGCAVDEGVLLNLTDPGCHWCNLENLPPLCRVTLLEPGQDVVLTVE